jgi:hypothetical protein
MSDIDVDKFLIGFAAFLGLWFLWRIAAHLEAIRDTLADIARGTKTAADRPTFGYKTDETNRLLKLKKQWGSAIDLGEDL